MSANACKAKASLKHNSLLLIESRTQTIK